VPVALVSKHHVVPHSWMGTLHTDSPNMERTPILSPLSKSGVILPKVDPSAQIPPSADVLYSLDKTSWSNRLIAKCLEAVFHIVGIVHHIQS